jgi:hypothetical protein
MRGFEETIVYLRGVLDEVGEGERFDVSDSFCFRGGDGLIGWFVGRVWV